MNIFYYGRVHVDGNFKPYDFLARLIQHTLIKTNILRLVYYM